MVVAAATIHGQSKKCRADRLHAIRKVFIQAFFGNRPALCGDEVISIE
jgi:hypothetical protein